jgi:pterin-4a-carbinolamine dehydratase
MVFSNINQTAKFFNIVAMESENLNHHPDIQINHGTELIITLITNDIQALSQYDF